MPAQSPQDTTPDDLVADRETSWPPPEQEDIPPPDDPEEAVGEEKAPKAGHRVAIVGGSSSGKSVYLGMLYHLFISGALRGSWAADWEDPDRPDDKHTRNFLQSIREVIVGTPKPNGKIERGFPPPTIGETALSFTLRRPWGMREEKLRIRSGDVRGEFTQRLARGRNDEDTRRFAQEIRGSRAVLFFIAGFPDKMPDQGDMESAVSSLLGQGSRVRYIAFVLAAADIFEMLVKEDPKSYLERRYAAAIEKISARSNLRYGIFPVYSIGRGRVFKDPQHAVAHLNDFDSEGVENPCADPEHIICTLCQRIDDRPEEIVPEGLLAPWDEIFKALRSPLDDTPTKAVLLGFLRPLFFLLPVLALAAAAYFFAWVPRQLSASEALELQSVSRGGFDALAEDETKLSYALELRERLIKRQNNPALRLFPPEGLEELLAETEVLQRWKEVNDDPAESARLLAELLKEQPESDAGNRLALRQRAVADLAAAMSVDGLTFAERLGHAEALIELADAETAGGETIAPACRSFGQAAQAWIDDTSHAIEAWSEAPSFGSQAEDSAQLTQPARLLERLQKLLALPPAGDAEPDPVAPLIEAMRAEIAMDSLDRVDQNLVILRRFAEAVQPAFTQASLAAAERLQALEAAASSLPAEEALTVTLQAHQVARMELLRERGFLPQTRIDEATTPWPAIADTYESTLALLAATEAEGPIGNALDADQAATVAAIIEKSDQTLLRHGELASEAKGEGETAGPQEADYWTGRATTAEALNAPLARLIQATERRELRARLNLTSDAVREAVSLARQRANFETLLAELGTFSKPIDFSRLDDWEQEFERVTRALLPDQESWKRRLDLQAETTSKLQPRVTAAAERLAELRGESRPSEVVTRNEPTPPSAETKPSVFEGIEVPKPDPVPVQTTQTAEPPDVITSIEQRLESQRELPITVLMRDLSTIEELMRPLDTPREEVRLAQAAATILARFRGRGRPEPGLTFLESRGRDPIDAQAAGVLYRSAEIWLKDPFAYGLDQRQQARLRRAAQSLRSSSIAR